MFCVCKEEDSAVQLLKDMTRTDGHSPHKKTDIETPAQQMRL